MKTLGRTQKITLGIFLAPFAVASAALFTGKLDGAQWSAHMQWLVPAVLLPLIGGGAWIKSKLGAPPKGDE
jgi:hypothetical protein